VLRAHRHQVLHCRRKRRAALLAVVVFVLTMAPARTGPPNPAGLVAAPLVAVPVFRAHLIASPFGTIHAATFRFSQPVGTEVPAFPGFRLAAYPADGDAALSSSYGDDDLHREFPEINRSRKEARLAPRIRPDFNAPLPAVLESGGGEAGLPSPLPSAGATAASGDEAMPDRTAETNAGRTPRDADLIHPPLDAVHQSATLINGAMIRMAWIYFATASPGVAPVSLEPWPAEAPGSDTPAEAPSQPPHNETIAAKGEVTGLDRRPKSPAELLDLEDAARAKHEKCLADAIYFEARGEPVRGQMAVAQVVINRVFSGHYPNNICGVVYQSTRRHRRLRCQFSFTCDGIPDRITEPDAWERATRIARDALDGNFWLNDIGKATHYHARWVYPRWVHEMRRLDRIGVHTFYRPRKWGDGAGSPVWGDAGATVEKL
jgi:spore germination cell wall hydrolase CwlJ-like protein